MFGGESLTAVDSYPQFQLLFWSVADLEGSDGVQQSEGHASDLPAVQLPVPHRQPRHDHVGIADGLHLGGPQDRRLQVSAEKFTSKKGIIKVFSPLKVFSQRSHLIFGISLYLIDFYSLYCCYFAVFMQISLILLLCFLTYT